MRRLAGIFILVMSVASATHGQGLSVSFAGFDNEVTEPIEIAADAMSLDQDGGAALLEGNVVIGQGDLRLAAPRVAVDYSEEGGISRIEATGGVTVVTPNEEVEAAEALYTLADDVMVLSGNVLLTQGRSAVSASRMRVDLATGTALLEGRVRTILQPAE